jgi:ATP-binding cassette subfamily F protein 3
MAGQKTKQAQSKLKYLSRIKRLTPPQEDTNQLKVRVQSSRRSYAQVLTVTNVALGYGNTVVIENASFEINRGDRVGLIGRNGSGKTSLLRALIGELAPIDGEIKLGANVDVAYFDQELADLNPQHSVLNSVWELDPMVEAGVIRSFLARFNFTGDDSLKSVAALSGGEKTKLSLARLLYYPANFLIFDEPTNHLDLDSREVLEEALLEYDGSCLIVSHDRHFLDRVVNRIFYVNQKKLQVVDGTYSDFHERTTPVVAPKMIKNSSSKENYLSFKEESKLRTKAKKTLLSVRSKISDHERELADIERALHSDIPKNDWEKLHAASEQKKQLEEKLLKLYGELESLEGAES